MMVDWPLPPDWEDECRAAIGDAAFARILRKAKRESATERAEQAERDQWQQLVQGL
jgi:hypothetical protein